MQNDKSVTFFARKPNEAKCNPLGGGLSKLYMNQLKELPIVEKVMT